MFLHLKNSDLSTFENLEEALDTLEVAIANATERRHNFAQQENVPSELLCEDAAQVVGGMVSKSLLPPPTTCGIIACEPELF
jgi:hypothetical protein